MRRNTLKLLACACTMALGTTMVSEANAQTVNVPITLGTESAISVTYTSDMDFGTWLLVHDGAGGDITLELSPLTGTVTNTNGGTSFSAEVTPSATVGVIAVATPAVATIQVYSTITDFVASGLAVASPTFTYNTIGPAAPLSILSGTKTSIVTTGGADTIEIGATVTVDATPSDAANNPASIDVVFSY